VLQDLLEAEQTEFLGRESYQRGGEQGIHRNGYEPGTLKSSEGVMHVQVPQVRGLKQPYQSGLWQTLGRTSEHLQALVTQMYANGLSTRDIESSLEQALGQFVLSKSSVSVITERLQEQYDAFKARDLSGFDVAYLFIDVVFEPLRRYGSRSGVMVCWGQCTDGSRVLLDLTLANNESYEATLDFLQSMIRRGLQTPLSCTTDGALGPIKAIEATWPRSKRIRCWFHKMQNLQQKIPPQAWPGVKALIEDLRDAPDFKQGQRRLEYCLNEIQKAFPEAARCLQEDSEALLNHLHFPTAQPLV
jgi:transposase-like protein